MDRQSRRWIGRIAALALIAAFAAGVPAPMQAALAATAVEVETELETLRVGRGDSLSVLLSRAGVRAVDADRISKAIQKKTNLRRMSIGREVRLLFRVEDERQRIPVAVSVETGQGRFVEATRERKRPLHRAPHQAPPYPTHPADGGRARRRRPQRDGAAQRYARWHPAPPWRRRHHNGRHRERAARELRPARPHAGPRHHRCRRA